MPEIMFVLAALSLVVWLYLIYGRDFFWRADQRLGQPEAAPRRWPELVAVVPARNEAEVIARAVASLLAQDYRGAWRVILVDDHSEDGTARAARQAARKSGGADRLEVVRARALPPGWTGKMWALAEGVARARRIAPRARYYLFTDADIAHAPDALRRLVAKAEAETLDLVSLMVKLRCRARAERWLIPAFVFFFQKLYPFPAVNDPRGRTAGAAGGCMLVRRRALERAGGIASIRGEIIDDCALAARLKPAGPIWLGLDEHSQSIRPYEGVGAIWNMVARTAYAQLRHSPLNLVGALLGMLVIYMAPVLALAWGLLSGQWATATMSLGALCLMAAAFQPTWSLYGRPVLALAGLPAAALFYTLMTMESARRHYLGRGGGWKGRTYPNPTP